MLDWEYCLILCHKLLHYAYIIRLSPRRKCNIIENIEMADYKVRDKNETKEEAKAGVSKEKIIKIKEVGNNCVTKLI